MNGKLKCDRCGRVMHEDCFAIVGEEVVCEICREKNTPKKGEVCIIDDSPFIRGCLECYLPEFKVSYLWMLPDDEKELAKYDVLIVDNDGIGNEKHKCGVDFLKTYEKMGNNKLVMLFSGLAPDKEDVEILKSRGIDFAEKGSGMEYIAEDIRRLFK